MGTESDDVRARAARFDLLFSQNVYGVFFMTFDRPVRWDAAHRDAVLDYAFEHLRLTAVNDVMCRQLGQPREQLLGTAPCDRWRGNPAEWRARFSELYDHGHLHQRLRAARGDGTWVEVEGEYVCIYDADGQITGHFGTQRDITENLEAAAALAHSQERLELAIAGGDIGVWDYDLVARTLHFDPGWIRRFGYGDEVAWRDPAWWKTINHPDDVAETEQCLADHAAGRTPLCRVEHRIRNAAGDWIWLLETGKITSRDPDGKPLRMVGTALDITERKRLHERLAASERLAALGTLAAGVGHEINNPLTYIVLNLQLIGRELAALERGAPSDGFDRIRTMVEHARYGAERVSAVVRDLKALTRAPDESVTILDPIAVVERCLQIADHQIRHRARIERELGPTPRVLANEGRLVQLFLNLIVNAVQALPEGYADEYWIRISSSTGADGRAVIEVADNGAGIAIDQVDRIFDPFFTTKDAGEGSGLGLAICRSIVTGLGGEIEVESSPGTGTRFRVALPAAGPTARPGSAARGAATPIASLRVLVIDDEPMIGELVKSVLGAHQVSAETSARAAVARLRAGERFDRILCDVMMPEVTGMDFYDQLGDVDPDLRGRVVFLTGGVFTERARSFLARVPNRRLDKPFDDAQLAAALADHTD